MAYKTIPWPYEAGVGPAYSADDWAKVWSWMGRNARNNANVGVLGGRGSLLVEQGTFPQLTVKAGAAMIDGRFCESDSDVNLSVSIADPTYDRIDLVVMRTNSTAKSVELAVKEGTPSPGPVAPTPVQDHSPYYELPLFEVRIPAGASSWQALNFKDVRRFWSDGEELILSVYTDSNTFNVGDPVFSNPTFPSNKPFMLRGFKDFGYQATTVLNPVLGIALEGGGPNSVIPVLLRGLTVLRLTTDVVAGDFLYVRHDASNPWKIGKYVSGSSVKPSNNRILGTALNSASAGDQCLVWVDPLAFWNMPRTYFYTAAQADNNVTSTAWVFLSYTGPDRNQPVQIRTPLVEIGLTAAAKHSAAGGLCYLSVGISGGNIANLPVLALDRIHSAGNWQNVSFTRIVDWVSLCSTMGLDPFGSHDLVLAAAKTNSGTLTIAGLSDSPLSFYIREVPPSGYTTL